MVRVTMIVLRPGSLWLGSILGLGLGLGSILGLGLGLGRVHFGTLVRINILGPWCTVHNKITK